MAAAPAPGGAQSDAAPDDFGIACFDIATGEERWRTPVTDGWPPRLRIAAGAVWARHGEAGTWQRHDLATGRVRARAEPPEEGAAPAAIDGGLWATTDAIVHLGDGDVAPRTIVTTGAFVDDLALAGEVLAFTLDRDDGQVYGFGLPEGRLRWVLRPRERVAGYEAGDGSRVELLG
ncbi:MAG: hypothetical protein ACREI7_06820, partial [Myxococcota bacterium]